MEQALALPYATLRFAHLGWRVIKLEAVTGTDQPGDPNRYIGRPLPGLITRQPRWANRAERGQGIDCPRSEIAGRAGHAS